MSNLNDFYKENKYRFAEGFSQQCAEQTEFLKTIVSNNKIVNVMEIGFHGGHSAETFLSTNKNIKLVSFDIGQHNCVNLGKSFIDNKYPGRHTLILGDSLITIPKYSSSNNIYFDVIFIDGGHFYNIAKGDLLNCKKLAHKDTIVVMDDTVNNLKWVHKHNEGPNKAWSEVKQNNIVNELGSIDYDNGRGMSWGKYNI